MSPVYIQGVEQVVIHAPKHQDTGVDEISVAALSGLLADDQHVLDAEVTAVAIPLAQKAAASGVASLDASSKVVQDPATSFIPSAQKAAASGVASLDASSLVVQNPANAVSTATASKVVIRDAAGRAKFVAGAAAGDAVIYEQIPTGGAKVTSGQYTGNDGVNRAIAHGLGVTPKIVFITKREGGYLYVINGTHDNIYYSPFANYLSATIPNATNFYVGNATSYPNSANGNAVVYDWVAIG